VSASHATCARLAALLTLAGSIALLESACLAAPPRVLPEGKLPQDSRLAALRGEQGEFPLVPARSPEEWQARAEHVRQATLVALGLWPMPEKTPLHAVIHGRRDQGEYTIEKVYFESVPGLFVTGSLYRPKHGQGRRPAVLSPHGHFPGGRFQDEGPDEVRRKIVQGAERFEDGGRSFMQSRCVQLARMGCVVFHYDMLGYGDCQQLSEELVHRFSRTRIKYREPPASGFYSAAAELRLQNVAGLHALNSIRALDFLAGLPDVDPERIAVTGGSGGGTQTFMLCALDDRPLVSVPVVIVSTTRQGGCTCENICGLRIDTNNIELTALHAPKPLLLVSADDATRTMPQQGFPELVRHYRALGAEKNVAHAALLQFPHNYNAVSRTAMYHFVNEHLRLGLAEPILERPYERLTREQLTVWDAEHPAPAGGAAFERELLAWLERDAQQQLGGVFPRDGESLTRYRAQVGAAWEILLRSLPADASAAFTEVSASRREGCVQSLGLVRYRNVAGHAAELPCVRLTPEKPGSRVVVWIDEAGKSGLYAADGSPKPAVRKLLDGGAAVWGVDLLYQGESLADGKPLARQRWLANEEGFAGWTYCYNQPLLAHRAQDILATIAAARGSGTRRVQLVGSGWAGVWCAAALALAGDGVERAAIDTGGFRLGALADVYDAKFLPGAVKYGDVPGLLALAAPTRLRIAGEGPEPPEIVTAAYRAADASARLSAAPAAPGFHEAAATWLLAE
jgi:dienelactone hydrolase